MDTCLESLPKLMNHISGDFGTVLERLSQCEVDSSGQVDWISFRFPAGGIPTVFEDKRLDLLLGTPPSESTFGEWSPA